MDAMGGAPDRDWGPGRASDGRAEYTVASVGAKQGSDPPANQDQMPGIQRLRAELDAVELIVVGAMFSDPDKGPQSFGLRHEGFSNPTCAAICRAVATVEGRASGASGIAAVHRLLSDNVAYLKAGGTKWLADAHERFVGDPHHWIHCQHQLRRLVDLHDQVVALAGRIADPTTDPATIAAQLEETAIRARDVGGEPKSALPFRLSDLGADQWVEEPAPIRWLSRPTIPLGVAGMVAAMGDAGKSGVLLELALRTATGELPNDSSIFGGHVVERGTAVIVTAEDSEASVQRRLHSLDPFARRRRTAPGKLLIAALPSLGGTFGLVRQDGRGLARTDEFVAILDQLKAIPDLKLAIFDPLQAFVHADVNASPEAAQFFCTALAEVAAVTGATVITAHHMRKPTTPPKTPEEAREAIRGTTTLVDGLRFAYAIWAVEHDDARRSLKEINRPYEPNAVFKGAIVKSNEPAAREVRTLVRSASTGILQDLTDRLKVVRKFGDDELAAMVTGIAEQAKAGRPLCRRGLGGVHARREVLPALLHKTGRDTLEEMVTHLLGEERVVQALANGTSTKWLDVPDGPFAEGTGQFAAGSPKGKPGPRGGSS